MNSVKKLQKRVSQMEYLGPHKLWNNLTGYSEHPQNRTYLTSFSEYFPHFSLNLIVLFEYDFPAKTTNIIG